MTHIAIVGVGGRMGRQLAKATLDHSQCSLTVATCSPNDSIKSTDVGPLIGEPHTGITITDNLEASIEHANVIIDFTRPETTMHLLTLCQQYNKGIVIGTTGFTETQKKAIQTTAKSIPIVLAPNMSPGVNLMFKLLEVAAQALGETNDIEIIEKHHRNKLDSPSGTAIKMGEIIASTLQRSLKEHAVYGRHGTEKTVRSLEDIGFSSIRAGSIIGDHTALFASESEVLEITHKSSSRTNYAKGAVQAAVWLNHQPEGLYDMMDVLGL